MINRRTRAGRMRCPPWTPPDPLAELASGIRTQEQAQFWMHFYEAMVGALAAAGPWPSVQALTSGLDRPDERYFMRNLRMLAANPERCAQAVHRLHSEIARLGLEWGL